MTVSHFKMLHKYNHRAANDDFYRIVKRKRKLTVYMTAEQDQREFEAACLKGLGVCIIVVLIVVVAFLLS